MTLTINGVDFTPYIAYQGLKYTRNDIDGPNAGRTMNGSMIRDRITTKDKWEVTCRPLTSAELQIVLSAIYPEYVNVTYYHPRLGTTVTKSMYSNNVPSQYLMVRPDGTEYWAGITFPLIER